MTIANLVMKQYNRRSIPSTSTQSTQSAEPSFKNSKKASNNKASPRPIPALVRQQRPEKADPPRLAVPGSMRDPIDRAGLCGFIP